MSKYILLDLDNCVSDDNWRLDTINPMGLNSFDKYHKYHMLAPFDRCGNRHLFMGEGYQGPLGNKEQIVVITGRPLIYHVPTAMWLNVHEIPATHLLMRPEDLEGVSAPALKIELLTRFLSLTGETFESVKIAYDDRQDVIDMYRTFGIKAERVFINDQHPDLTK